MSVKWKKPFFIGQTKDGKLVINGEFFFFMMDTHGLPLCISMEWCDKYDLRIDWIGFIKAALKQNWKHDKIISVINEGFDLGTWHEEKDKILEMVKNVLLMSCL